MPRDGTRRRTTRAKPKDARERMRARCAKLRAQAFAPCSIGFPTFAIQGFAPIYAAKAVSSPAP